MGTVIVVGLGPGPAALVTDEARLALTGRSVYLRTDRHPALATIPGLNARTSLDEHIDDSEDASAAVQAFIESLLAESTATDVTYAVPGHPALDDASVRLLRERAAPRGVPVRFIRGVSAVDYAAEFAGLEGFGTGVQIVDLLDIAVVGQRSPFAGGQAPISPLCPVLLLNPRPASLLRDAGSLLGRLYPSDQIITAMDSEPEAVVLHRVLLDELEARDASGWTAALYLPPVRYETSGRTAEALQQIVARLRAPGGCPWDREQTHGSLLQSGLEEAYEAFDAIQRGDRTDMVEELGDLLLQVFLHAQIAEEAAEFALEDVYGAVTAKLVRRHPHVFGDVVAASAGEVLSNWDQIKRGERAARGEVAHENPLGKIPAGLPALLRTQTVLRRARRSGLLRIDERTLRDAARAALDSYETPRDETLVDAVLAITLAATAAGMDLEQGLRARSRLIEESAGRLAATGRQHEEPANHREGMSRLSEGDRSA
ncbi:MAG TPA: MazG family protein [Thermomicrobiaceae bacterium]|nr:MazG family protein [Thermomicrobiaceae bacterium]